ncbi:MAG: Zn-ribbon domain-containing OB-fold protein [Anaerolineae bacterium]|nr:Zn-ribbon domain-containing OB-fold protein [Anaerolineae bacterium]MCX8066582.1 Zn-ribbon domain-containing OB-fold protein [Anaerolineae bacterium]MDW7991623.1 Zn-ribbon domain-containing OB-fold protein [Anaerolineae bacterium]
MKEFVYNCVSLSEEDFTQGRVLFETWKPVARYAWDAGIAIGRYLRELKNGRLIGVHCPNCGRVLVPPRMFCQDCFVPIDGFVPLQDTGTVVTFSICYIRWDMVRLEHPLIPAVIAIDGASPGMGILHLLGEVKPEDVRIGMRVRAVWKPAEERVGAITDIRYFKPIE